MISSVLLKVYSLKASLSWRWMFDIQCVLHCSWYSLPLVLLVSLLFFSTLKVARLNLLTSFKRWLPPSFYCYLNVMPFLHCISFRKSSVSNLDLYLEHRVMIVFKNSLLGHDLWYVYIGIWQVKSPWLNDRMSWRLSWQIGRSGFHFRLLTSALFHHNSRYCLWHNTSTVSNLSSFIHHGRSYSVWSWHTNKTVISSVAPSSEQNLITVSYKSWSQFTLEVALLTMSTGLHWICSLFSKPDLIFGKMRLQVAAAGLLGVVWSVFISYIGHT